jgi:hypothetical protein
LPAMCQRCLIFLPDYIILQMPWTVGGCAVDHEIANAT